MTMKENAHLQWQLEQAGRMHGHICPSLFYGVCLARRIKEWLSKRKLLQPLALILEGKSVCIRDGVRSVLSEYALPLRLESNGQCALTVICQDQQRYRVSISPPVRLRINELNQSLPLEEFKQVGVAYLQSLSERELFGE
ncbi:MAG: hypothetical protein K6U11_09545 [bacterium]|nr:hypothetical protein [bacterium]